MYGVYGRQVSRLGKFFTSAENLPPCPPPPPFEAEWGVTVMQVSACSGRVHLMSGLQGPHTPYKAELMG